MLILVCNVGSTSLKYKLFDMPEARVLVESKIERVGTRHSSIFSYRNVINGKSVNMKDIDVPGYSEGINLFLGYLTGKELGAVSDIREIDSIGYKTVHAKGFSGVQELDDPVMKGMEEYLTVAPVHNKYYIEAIKKFKEILPDKTMMGVFETYFNQTIPPEAGMYGIPYEWYEKYGIKRYGFHGSSHQYISGRVKKMEAGRNLRLISCHLGGSSSICAVKNGVSVDNSFGFSPQSGLSHSSRTGEIDSHALIYLMKQEGFTLDEVIEGLDKKGGLYGISGVSNDLREIEEAAAKGNGRAKLAIDTFCHEIIRYIGSYYAVLGGLDYLVFTGGIGENSYWIRAEVCGRLEHMGIKLDAPKNRQGDAERVISAADSKVKVMTIPANEELVIAENIYRKLCGK